MADKIVILEDSEGNNIYPISRGLATNSVDTNAIQNGAVTSAKIDYATLDLSSSVSSSFSTSVSRCVVKRSGRVVTLEMRCTSKATSGQATIVTLPSGLLPADYPQSAFGYSNGTGFVPIIIDNATGNINALTSVSAADFRAGATWII